MRGRDFIVAAAVGVLTTACESGLRKPPNATPGTPNVTWVLMFGDSDNPDREFACQSGPPADCVLPASRPGEQVFSDLHFYYHGTGNEIRYEGTRDIGYLQVSGSYTSQTNVQVRKDQSIANQSVVGIVTSTPGNYTVTLSLTATTAGTRQTVPVRETIQIAVK
jgi:hypothetical protein